MSAKERDQMVAIKAVDAGQITQRQAAEQLGRTERQVRRILQRYRAEGGAGVIYRSRGRVSQALAGLTTMTRRSYTTSQSRSPPALRESHTTERA